MDEFLSRCVANIIPGREELEKLLNSDRKLNIYMGIDPTATKIHLGHGVSLRILNKFAQKNHNVTFLIGDFTALIGDNSDKETERPLLTPEEIENNFQSYKEQASKILDFDKVSVRRNSEWLKNLNFAEIIKLTQLFSVNDFLSRELIRKRLDDGKRVGLHEFLYPLMQGYDSNELDTDIQIGGTDQTFNMQAGRTFIKHKKNKESFVITTEFLMGTDGRKMSKSWGNAIWLTDEPFEMFRKVMAINDDLIKSYFTLGTNVPLNQIPTDSEINKNPLEIKKKLATIIVSELHNEDDANKAKEEFEKVVQNKEIPQDLSEIEIKEDTVIDDDFLVQNGLANSKSEAKRLFEQNAVSLNEEKIKMGEGFCGESGENMILRIGKKMIKLNIRQYG